MTLVEVAAKAGLSHPFLSQLERGLAQPSMGSLERIARALGSSQLELFAAAEDVIDAHSADEVSLVRAGEGTQGPYAEGQGRLLVHGVRRFHPMEFIGDNRAAGDFYEHDEDEFLHVLEGEIELELDGAATYTLGPGDSVYYKAGTLHRWSSPNGPYRLFIVKQSPQRLGNLEGT